jgi:hypothetical protein
MNWGNLFSAAGFCVSVATLIVARWAKQAAEEAKAEARARNLADELREAQSKAEQIGTYLSQEKWEIVLLRAQEVVTSCSQILRRWGPKELSEQSRNNVLLAQQQAGSIARVALRAPRIVPSEQDVRRLAVAQHKTLQLLAGETADIAGKMETRWSMTDKERELISQLLEKTSSKTIPWEPTARENEFVAPYKGHATFTISRFEDPSYYGDSFRFVMRDSSDREMLEIMGNGAFPPDLDALGRLYRAAHDSALKVEETLDAILDDLKSWDGPELLDRRSEHEQWERRSVNVGLPCAKNVQ